MLKKRTQLYLNSSRTFQPWEKYSSNSLFRIYFNRDSFNMHTDTPIQLNVFMAQIQVDTYACTLAKKKGFNSYFGFQLLNFADTISLFLKQMLFAWNKGLVCFSRSIQLVMQRLTIIYNRLASSSHNVLRSKTVLFPNCPSTPDFRCRNL